MEASLTVLTAILPIFSIIGCGVLARMFGWLDESADKSLMKLIINLLYPALIFNLILGNDILRKPENLIIPPLLGLGSILIGFLIASLFAKWFKIGSKEDRRTFSFVTGIYNSFYFSLPVVGLFFDREVMGLLLVFNLGVELAIWLVGVGFILVPMQSKSLFKRLINAPVIAVLLASWLNYIRVDQVMPESALKVIGMLGQCAIPLGLILIGATFVELKATISTLTKIKIPILASVLRLAVIPATLLCAAYFMELSPEMRKVVVVQAAMPCAVFPIVLVRHFGGSADIAFKIVLSTTLLSLFTIPFWIKKGMELLGLKFSFCF